MQGLAQSPREFLLLRGNVPPGEDCYTVLFPHGFRKSSSMLEVDDEGGRMFLRVLIHLTMHDYPPLVSGSLQLLFKHFSQRQEVLHTFKQVTLLGGSQDVIDTSDRSSRKSGPALGAAVG